MLISDEFLAFGRGIVWATYDLGQAEVVQAALQAQRLTCEVQQELRQGRRLYLLRVPLQHHVEAAKDFVWRDADGLRLQPDWSYPADSPNESFLRWTKGAEE